MLIHSSTFLRRVLLADAVSTGASGLLLVLGSGVLAPMLRLPAALLFYSGVSFLAFATLVGPAAARRSLPRAAAWAIVLYNALWAAASVAFLLSGAARPTALGYAFVLAQASFVTVMAELQYAGLRRSTTAAAAE